MVERTRKNMDPQFWRLLAIDALYRIVDCRGSLFRYDSRSDSVWRDRCGKSFSDTSDKGADHTLAARYRRFLDNPHRSDFPAPISFGSGATPMDAGDFWWRDLTAVDTRKDSQDRGF
jgi:hypothetical protein